jgi:DNA polymerase elongation subunit (family B)
MQRTADARERSRLDAMQSSLKILINSFYGYLGYDRGLFNDHQKADEVTRSGQELLHLMISTIRQQGGLVVEVDTDGIFFVPPSHAVTEQAEEDLVAELSRRMPEGITVTLDGRYRKMLSYKKKNYALLSYDNKLTVKGSSLTSRSIEHFGRAYIRTCISCLLCEDIPGLHQAYVEMREKIAGHRLSVRDFARTEALSETLAEYRSAVESGRRTRSAPYEIALTMGRPIRRSERISYYVTGDEPNPRTFENCKPASEWDPNFPDENIPYYIRRLDEFSEKFQPFFTPQDFRKVFSVEDLFPFSPEGITILSPDVSAVETRDEA